MSSTPADLRALDAPETASQQSVKRYLPRSLFGRSLMIIFAPLLLVQLTSVFVFYDQLWEALSKRLSAGVAGEVSVALEIFEHRQAPGERARLLAAIKNNTGMELYFEPGAELPITAEDDRTAVAKMLGRAMTEQVQGRHAIDDHSDEHHVLIAIEREDGVMHAIVSRNRLFSAPTYFFLLWQTGSAILLSIIAALFMRNQVRPIRRLADAAERFGRGLTITGFKPEGATEVRRAAGEFNRMRERITRQIAQRTEMLAGVSHDLRTPLTRLKLQLAMLGDTPETQNLRDDVAEMERLVDGYLAFVRGEGGEATVESRLSPLIEDVIERARQNGATITLTGRDDFKARLKPEAFRRSLTNLVNNAMRYGQNIAIAVAKVGPSIEVTVDDDGPGIPAAQREEAFRPFFRLDSSRNSATGGIGLGLAITRDLIRSLGGDVMLGPSPLGGLRATIRLPL